MYKWFCMDCHEHGSEDTLPLANLARWAHEDAMPEYTHSTRIGDV